MKPVDNELVCLQTSRGEVVLQLEIHHGEASFMSKARAEIQGLPAYHRMLTLKKSTFACPALKRANWDERVMEMEIVDPFGNHIIFCEPSL